MLEHLHSAGCLLRFCASCASLLLVAIVGHLARHGLDLFHCDLSLQFLDCFECVFELGHNELLASFTFFLQHDEQANLLVQVRYVLPCVIQEKKLRVKLVLVLLLLLLPADHLGLHLGRVRIDHFLEHVALVLDVFDLGIELAFDF